MLGVVEAILLHVLLLDWLHDELALGQISLMLNLLHFLSHFGIVVAFFAS